MEPRYVLCGSFRPCFLATKGVFLITRGIHLKSHPFFICTGLCHPLLSACGLSALQYSGRSEKDHGETNIPIGWEATRRSSCSPTLCAFTHGIPACRRSQNGSLQLAHGQKGTTGIPQLGSQLCAASGRYRFGEKYQRYVDAVGVV